MQSKASGGTSGVAVFKNCIVERINLKGNYVGGFYGGKWNSDWTTYSLTFDNCKMIGLSSAHNTIVGNNLDAEGYAGGFIGRLYPYTNVVKVNNKNTITHNVLIKDCMISNYDITALTSKTSYVGGFIGYASSAKNSVTCYLHDSSIENCSIGANGNYAGGIIGKIEQKDANQLLGYNIKLDTITTGSGSKMGAWIGYAPNDTSNKKTSIQFAGMAIYRNGFTKNIGNDATIGTASFVFADYNGASNGTSSEVTATAGENEENSVTESYSVNTTDKIITRTIVTVTINGTEKKTKTQTIQYHYDSEAIGNPVVISEGVDADSTTWSVSESEGKILKVVANAAANTKTTTTYTIAVSGLNAASNVTMPKYPFVNINPQSDMGTGEIISGDGAVLYDSTVTGYNGKTGDKTMAAKIYSELLDTTNTRRYTTFVDTAIKGTNTIDNYLKHSPGVDGTRISTYFTEKGYTQSTAPNGVKDFAVIVINDSDNAETTELINRYIQLVTNTSTDYTEYKFRDPDHPDPYIHIDVKPCEYKGGKFQIMSTGQAGLRLGDTQKNVGGNDVTYTQFQLVSSDADETDQFTLIDVQFKDPFDSNQIAYHLYVPVYTIKQIEVKFYASAMTGSSSVSNPRNSDYITLMQESGRGTLIDSLDTWVTQYIRFRYSGEDINSLLSEGSVNWNYDKKVTFVNQQSGYTLPNNTFMVLVDPNGDQDRMYYANGTAGFAKQNSKEATGQQDLIVELNKFTRTETVDDGNGGTTTNVVQFSTQNLNVLIASSIEESEGTNYTAGTSSDFDVYRTYVENGIKKTAYYKYSQTGQGIYNLSVSNNSTFDEDYYISMFVPTPVNYTKATIDQTTDEIITPAYRLFYYEITPPTELTGTRKAKLTPQYTYNMMIANLFEQDTTLQYKVSTETDERQITESNNTLFVEAKCKITLKNENARTHLSGSNLYHAINIMLNRYEDTGVTNDIQGLGNVTGKYSINGDVGDNSPSCVIDGERTTYLNVRTTDILSYITEAANTSRSVQVAAKVTIPFDNIDLEFPPGSSTETEIGVNVASTSNLSYYLDKLAYTSMSQAFPSSSNYYYIEDINNAVLDYNTVDMLDAEDKVGEKSFNYSRIGINGRTDSAKETWMSIPTKADYNTSAVENPENADKLRITLWLEKKENVTENETIKGAKYQPIINLANYMSIDSVTTGTNNLNSFTKNNTLSTAGNATLKTPEKVVYEISNPSTSCTHLEGDIGYTFRVNVKVKTGSTFTDYSNYRIRIEAELIDTIVENEETIDKPMDNSNAKNWLVYTNAKVYPTAFDR